MEALRGRGFTTPVPPGREGTALGYLLLWKHRDARFFSSIISASPKRRNGGIGAKLLQAVFDYYPASTVFLGESEAPTGNRRPTG